MLRAYAAGLALALLVGCAKTDENAPPKGASSANDVGYALAFPDQVDASTTSLQESEADLATQTQAFAAYPDKIHKPQDPNVVADVYRAADEAGRSEGYVRIARDNEVVQDFMAEDQGMISKKVAGGVQFMAKQQGCGADLGGAAAGTLKRTVDKQLRERLNAANDAHRIIDENQAAVGKGNMATLHTQAQDIAHASYVAYMALPARRGQLRSMQSERSKVQRTLQAKIEEDEKMVASADVSAGDKKAAQARLAELEAAQDQLEQSQQAHEDALKDLDARIEAAQNQYDAALDELLEKFSDNTSQSSSEADGDAKVDGKLDAEASVDVK